jgi:hypothetical protein
MRILIAAANIFKAHLKMAATIVAGATFLSFAPAAHAVSYNYSTSGAVEPLFLGNTLGILVAGGTFGSTTNNILLNQLVFAATPGAPATYNNLSFQEQVTISAGGASGTQTLVVPFSLSVGSSDTLTIAGTSLSILVGANLWNIVVDGLTIVSPGVANLYAQVSESPAATPLPAAVVLFGSGLGAMGLFARRRKRKDFAAPAAAA